MFLIAFISQCHGRALQEALKQTDDLIAGGLYSVIEGLGTYEQTVKGARELQAKRCRREKEAEVAEGEGYLAMRVDGGRGFSFAVPVLDPPQVPEICGSLTLRSLLVLDLTIDALP